jgi:hypothetical protein
LTNSLLSFLEHMSLFSTHNWRWSMQRHLETCQTRFTFSLWPPPLLSLWLLFTSTHRPLFYQKTMARKKLRNKFKKCKCFLRFSIAKIQPNPKKNRQFFIRGFQVGSHKIRERCLRFCNAIFSS